MKNQQPDVNKTQAVAEYAADIYQYLCERESVLQVKEDYMKNQQDVTEKMRMILVDWLVEVHWKFKLSNETLFATVHLLDTFLSRKQVKRTKLQLVGVTCMLLASKHEEIYPPEIKDFVHVTDKAYTKQEILNMEVSALNTLGFQLTSPSPLAFLQHGQGAGMHAGAHLVVPVFAGADALPLPVDSASAFSPCRCGPVLGEQDHEDLSGVVAEAAGRDGIPGVADQELREGNVRSPPGCREGVAPGRAQEVLAVGVPPRREDGCVSTGCVL